MPSGTSTTAATRIPARGLVPNQGRGGQRQRGESGALYAHGAAPSPGGRAKYAHAKYGQPGQTSDQVGLLEYHQALLGFMMLKVSSGKRRRFYRPALPEVDPFYEDTKRSYRV